MMTSPQWHSEAKSVVSGTGSARLADYRQANEAIVRCVARGNDTISGKPVPNAGVRLVFNIAAAHVPALLKGGLLNCYDLEAATIGGEKPHTVSNRRRMVDMIIADLPGGGGDPAKLYYGAIELNGAGMRYYGDFCLVVKPEAVDDGTLVLFRNSFDLDRDPISSRIARGASTRSTEAADLAGAWAQDVSDMIVCKAMDGALGMPRLITTGSVSQAILDDEDYLEVPRVGAIVGDNLQEVRITAADAAAEALIGERASVGPPPTLAQRLWRQQRRDAELAARKAGLDVRIVTTSGRTRA